MVCNVSKAVAPDDDADDLSPQKGNVTQSPEPTVKKKMKREWRKTVAVPKKFTVKICSKKWKQISPMDRGGLGRKIGPGTVTGPAH